MSDQEQRPLPAVLLLAYRRPDTTALVLEALRQVRPRAFSWPAMGLAPGIRPKPRPAPPPEL
ncbi:hypothetical protein [Cyanobium sp. ATX-6F1]|uniref:hypothetical protein n=1 Tax=Cyanobium sp. ATX-6F1 TaxID=3137388 RepID=UPI0039BDBE46